MLPFLAQSSYTPTYFLMFLFSLEGGLVFPALNSLGKLLVERHVGDGKFFTKCGGNRWRALKFEFPGPSDSVTGVKLG